MLDVQVLGFICYLYPIVTDEITSTIIRNRYGVLAREGRFR